MAYIKIKNASNCAKCSRSGSCDCKMDYLEFVETVQTIADTYNSINAKLSLKCKKEC